MEHYKEKYFDYIISGASRSAKEIVLLVMDLINPKSVVDIGCGLGTWLSAFSDQGVKDILGIDGGWVNQEHLVIPKENFLVFDLRKPLYLDGQFDLVISLEVAEHLPSEMAETIVNTLTNMGPVILFSAAIPLQGGTNHLNEQWPEYWAEIFLRNDYVTIDCIRKHIWKNEKVEYFYAQNMLIFASRQYLEKNPLLKIAFEDTNLSMLSLVHPKKYLFNSDYKNLSLKKVLWVLPYLIKRALISRTRRLNELINSWLLSTN